MANQINLNADMGEGFGAYDIGNDAELLTIVTSANVACGFHAGDPNVMHRVVTRAKERGVSIGAHPGFNDLWGFGRRRIDMKPSEVEYMIAYQIGALQAISALIGVKVTHVKAHGALHNMAAMDADLAMAIGRAIKAVDRNLIYLALAGSAMEKAGETLGLPVAREAFVDRLYEDDGNLTSRKISDAVIKDASFASERAVRMVLDQAIVSRHGKRMPTRIDSLCVHGDEPTAIAVARAARAALEVAHVRVVPLTAMGIA
jgi:UPF0271 protein